MERENSCQLCGSANIASTVDLKPVSSLWMEMYHKNVRELLLPQPESDMSGGPSRVPKLTFTFSFTGTPAIRHERENREEEDNIWLCETCLEEVNQLKVLHQQLEACKKKISAQVGRIDNVFENAVGASTTRRRQADTFWKRKSFTDVGPDMAFAGTTVGRGNITQMLRCLGSLCEDVGNTNEDSPANENEVIPKIEVIEPASIIGQCTTQETIPTEPIMEDDNRSSSLGADDDATYHNCDSRQQLLTTTTVHNGVETFSHIVKIDPESYGNVINVMTMATSINDPHPPEDLESEPIVNDDPLAEGDLPWSINATTSLSTKETPNRVRATTTKRRKVNKTTSCSAQRKRPGETKNRYECEFCGKKFRAPAKATEHRRTHTGEKPFTCNLCNRSFAHLSAFKRHNKSKHKTNTDEANGYSFRKKPKRT